MRAKYDNIAIKGIVTVVPKNIENNEEYVAKLESRRIKKQILLTGIKERRACINGQSSGDLCTLAADKLLDNLGWDRDDIKCMVYVTQSSDLSRPSTAFIIQKRLEIGKQCMVFDVNLGCSGYVAGLQIVSGLLHNVGGKALLLTGESGTFENGYSVSTSSLLNGDAGSATAIEVDCKASTMYCEQCSDGYEYKKIYKPHGKPGFMDGNGVLLFTLNEVVNSIKSFKKDFEIDENEIDYYVLHQAQKMILDGVAKGCSINKEKILSSCEYFGNTSSASIPLTLCTEIEKIKCKELIKVYMCGFGIGLSWGSVVMDINTSIIYPIIESNYVYPDKKEYT